MTTVYRAGLSGELYEYEYLGLATGRKPLTRQRGGFPGYATLRAVGGIKDGRVGNYRLDTVIVAPAVGARVVTGSGEWVVTFTPEGLACDCGKGAYCPLNPQTRRTA